MDHIILAGSNILRRCVDDLYQGSSLSNVCVWISVRFLRELARQSRQTVLAVWGGKSGLHRVECQVTPGR
jgi:hypothetical protein